MRRFEAIKRIMEVVTDEIVVCNLGHPSQELYMNKDRPENFYMLGSMGLASSIGLGIAMSQERRVVVIDGDGAVMMNLSTFASIGVVRPKNYILAIIDNGAYGSTGFQETFSAKGIDLARIAESCNIETVTVFEEDRIKERLETMLKGEGPYCLLIKVKKGMPDNLNIIPYDSTAIRDRFTGSIR